jgi:hypothetical protein
VCRVLRLASNSLSGSVPIVIGNLANLEVLDLHSNFFQGDVPEVLASLLNLR